MKLKISLILCLTLTSMFAVAGGGSGVEPANILNVNKVHNVYDGDTFRAYFGNNEHHEPIRIKGVDTPEIKGACGAEKQMAIQARDFLRATLRNAKSIQLESPSRDKYQRVLARVIVDGNDLANMIVQGGHGRVWRGKREKWCN
jgi:endonuclease YncB( thermonuclease family)